MKKLMMAVVGACALVVCADEQTDKFLARTGGWLDRPQNGKAIRVVNRQNKVDKAILEEFATGVSGNLSLPVEIVKGEAGKCYASAKDEVNGFCVLLDDNAKCPLKMIAAPDDCYAMVNVAALSSDGVSGEALAVRVTKELWRGLVYGLGGGNNEFPGCLMVPAPGLKELDAIRAKVPCPAPFNQMSATAHRMGIPRVGKVTYRQACREGWAPQPTNDFQKVIWDEVKAKPTKPLTIKYDKKIGK